MARIAGVDLPRRKRLEIALTYIYGIGSTTSKKILSDIDLDPNRRVEELDEGEVRQIRDYIEVNYKVEGELRNIVKLNIKRLMDLGDRKSVV